MKSYAYATITELQNDLKTKKVSPKELVDYFSDRYTKYNEKLGACLELFDKESVVKKSSSTGPLTGIPGAIKDNICQEGRITSCASKILENFKSPYDATIINDLKQSGALLLSRSNCDEFAMGSSTETSAFQLSRNPWNTDCSPGGSSGGSAVAVAAGLVPWALGSETGGSVRQPAALCGIYGLKPTYGLLSRYGLVAYASSLDQIGIFSRSVEDNAKILSVVAGHDMNDSTTLAVDKKDYTAHLSGKLKDNCTIGVIENALNAEGLDDEVRDAIETVIKEYEKLGATIKRITVPAMDFSAATYFVVSRAEAASNLARFDGVRYGFRAENVSSLSDMYETTRHDGFGSEVQARIMVGNYVLSAGHAGKFYTNAQKVQNRMRQEVTDAFNDVDLLLAPTAPAPAFKIGAFDDNKLQLDLQDYFTCIANLTGIPALSIPCGFSKEDLPMGFQLMAPHLHEGLLYQTAQVYEKATPWHTMHPGGYE